MITGKKIFSDDKKMMRVTKTYFYSMWITPTFPQKKTQPPYSPRESCVQIKILSEKFKPRKQLLNGLAFAFLAADNQTSFQKL